MEDLKLIECPRDAMQGIKDFIPTTTKVRYINEILKVGFDTVDFGSFVSPKAIPQMRDTAEVLSQLHLDKTQSKLLAIVANERGAQDASQFDEINYLGYPFSISETFQQRNTNASISDSLERLEKINNLALKANKEVVVYLSMGFGNPYGDEWGPGIVIDWTEKLVDRFGIKIVAISDTIGVAEPGIISSLFNKLIPALPDVEFGAHMHTTPETYHEKIKAAYDAGCRRFDGAIKGYGGCPMAKDDLTGNMPTEKMVEWFVGHNISTGINKTVLDKVVLESNSVFKSF